MQKMGMWLIGHHQSVTKHPRSMPEKWWSTTSRSESHVALNCGDKGTCWCFDGSNVTTTLEVRCLCSSCLERKKPFKRWSPAALISRTVSTFCQMLEIIKFQDHKYSPHRLQKEYLRWQKDLLERKRAVVCLVVVTRKIGRRQSQTMGELFPSDAVYKWHVIVCNVSMRLFKHIFWRNGLSMVQRGEMYFYRKHW